MSEDFREGKLSCTVECPCCGLPVTIVVNKEDLPSTYVTFCVMCTCGELVEFVIPIK